MPRLLSPVSPFRWLFDQLPQVKLNLVEGGRREKTPKLSQGVGRGAVAGLCLRAAVGVSAQCLSLVPFFLSQNAIALWLVRCFP